MNKLLLPAALTITGIIVLYGVGFFLFLSPTKAAIATICAKTHNDDLETVALRAKLETLSTEAKPEVTTRREPKLLPAGDEGKLMRKVYAAADFGHVLMESFALLPTYRVKGKKLESVVPEPTPEKITSQNLPQLDDNGMPIGATTEEGDDQWLGVEVAPIQLKVKSTLRGIGKFLANLDANMPLFNVHSLNLKIRSSGLVVADVVLAVPLGEPSGPSKQKRIGN